MTVYADDECIHGMYPAASCTICNGRDARELKAATEAPRTFPARYASQCPECDLPISEGQTVTWLPGRPATHEECWRDE